MIDRHGWSPRDWDEQSREEKAITIASLEYHNEQRQRQAKKAKAGSKRMTRKVV